MNEPIISPFLFYWAGRIELIRIICCVVGFVVTALVITIAIAVLTDDCEHDYSVKQLKILACVALILDTLAVFLPTKTEMIAMYAAEHITPANIEATGEPADKAVDKLIEKILKASKAVKE